MAGVSNVIQIIGGDRQHGAEGEVVDPGFVEIVQAGQIFGRNGALVFASTRFDAPEQGRHRSAEVDHQIGRGQKADHGFVKLAIGLVITWLDMPIHEEVLCKNFGIFIDTAILNNRSRVQRQLMMATQAMR